MQRSDFEKELSDVKVKIKKGKSAAVFHTLEKINGSKKSSEGQLFMTNPSTNLPMFEPAEIKSAAVHFVKDLLQNKFVCKDYESFYYLQDMIHNVRLGDDEANDMLTNTAFENRLNIIKKKCPEKYNFILHSGEALRNCIFRLFEKVWTPESLPDQ